MSKKITFEEFVRRAREKHGDKYEYVKDSYDCISAKIKIICPKHGVFEQQCYMHCTGQGCRKCSSEELSEAMFKDKDFFVKRARGVHGDRYSYERLVYKGTESKGMITCLKHGDFEQKLNNHLQGNGCPKCHKENRGKYHLKTQETFINQANELYKGVYDYSLVKYVKTTEKVKIICKEHGIFEKTPHKHLLGQGCVECAKKKMREKTTMQPDEFIKRCKDLHKNFYDYTPSVYKGWDEKVSIICPKHGIFNQRGGIHLTGGGCPKCGHQVSKAEQEISDFLKTYVNVKQSDRQSIKPLELDMYLKDLNIGVEYHGLFYHSDKFRDKNYHLEKLNLCNSKGIKLIQIFEDEWSDKKEICKSRLLNLTGKTPNKIFARKCVIKEVSASESRAFLETNHIQGNVGAKIKLGLYYEDELVSIMTFGNLRKNLGQTSKEGSYELLRFCNKLNTNVVGGASKLLKHFEKTYQPKEIISYADRRWSEGKLYQNLGFSHTSNSQPNYFYVKSVKRENRFNYRKSELIKQGFDPNKTEKQIMDEQGFVRIYDCGAMKFTKNY